jgi:capsid protein
VKLERVPVDAAEIIHKFIQYRPGQTRGVTLFAPILLDLKMLDGYQQAELVATRMAAAKMGFLVQKNPGADRGRSTAASARARMSTRTTSPRWRPRRA